MPLTASSCGRLSICSRKPAAACKGNKAPIWCVLRYRKLVLTAQHITQCWLDDTWDPTGKEGLQHVRHHGTLCYLRLKSVFNEFGSVLTLVWLPVCGTLAQRSCRDASWGRQSLTARKPCKSQQWLTCGLIHKSFRQPTSTARL